MDQRFANHWQWRPEWGEDRPCLLWYLTFEDQPSVLEHAEQLESSLRTGTNLDVVPPKWLHLTVDDVAYTDEVSSTQVESLVQATRETVSDCLLPPLELGPVSAMSSAVVLPARPRSPLLRLRERVQAATASVLGRDKPPLTRDFWPHVSLGYVNDECAQRSVMEPLDPADPDVVQASVSRLTLAAVTRRRRHYQWTTRAVLPLPHG
jgi:2'-5' RNA ligase